MSEILAFIQLGFRHIVALDAADHIFFLLALAAIYRGRDWRSMLWVVTAFTAGHSLTLALAVTNLVVAPGALIEFLIPVTIVSTGVENLYRGVRGVNGIPRMSLWYRPLVAGVFGLVHGAGFADYLRGLFVDRLAAPLFGFNVGIEIGQVVVLACAFALFWAVDRALSSAPIQVIRQAPFHARLVTVSVVVTIVAAAWAVERWPL